MARVSTGYRTPLSRARGLGSAKHGVGHFIGQRVSAVALLFLLLWGVWSALKLAPIGFEGATAWLRSPVNAALLALLFATGLYHVRIGAQVIIEDYIPTPLTRSACLLANLFICFGAFAVAVISVLKVAFSVSGVG